MLTQNTMGESTISLKKGIDNYLLSLICNNEELSKSSSIFIKKNKNKIGELLFSDLDYLKTFDIWSIKAIAKALPEHENKIINLYNSTCLTSTAQDAARLLIHGAFKLNTGEPAATPAGVDIRTTGEEHTDETMGSATKNGAAADVLQKSLSK